MEEVNAMGDLYNSFPFQEFTRYFDFMRNWGDLHEKFVQCASPQFAGLPALKRREFLANAVAEDDMLVSMSSDLGLFREVTKRLKSKSWFAGDLEALAAEVAVDLMFPGNSYDGKERDRLLGLYPELFFKLGDVRFGEQKSCPLQLKDVESDIVQLDDLDTALTCVRWSAVSKDVDSEEGFIALMQELVDHGLRLRGVDPISLESLSDFQEILDRKAMEVTAKMGLPDDRTSWILFAIQDRVMVPETLHFLIMQAMGLRMFREMEHGSRHEMMDQEYKLQLGPAYATRSVLLLGDYYRDMVQAPEKMLKAIEAHVRDGRPQFALELCLESIKNLPMEAEHKDQMALTLGILYLANDKPRKAAESFLRSLDSSRKTLNPARESVVCAYLGSSYALMRRKEEGHRAFEESLAIASKRTDDAPDLLEELMLMADLAHDSNEHRVEKGFLQKALTVADGMADETKLKQQISLMIEAAEAHLENSIQV
ncbi:MAG TPA: tetratricopeptide repeat protein [Methanomassiliicoccales archaeon]|jgi:tetratricopeptide (TPR) repeat protein